MLRVVRLKSGMPMRDSIRERCLLTAAGVTPNSRAVLVMEQAFARARKNSMSAGLISLAITIKFLLKMI